VKFLPGVAINSCLNDKYAMASMSLTGERLVPLLKRKRGRPAKVKGKRGRPSKVVNLTSGSFCFFEVVSSLLLRIDKDRYWYKALT
jgi:hypothetical protein